MNLALKGCLLCIAALSITSPDLFAHGGQYRGPGDVVPPNPGSRGPSSAPGASGGPATGPTTGPGSPARPGGSGGPGTGGSGPAGGGLPGGSIPGTPVTGANGPDLSPWSFWWEFNKDPYLNLRSIVHSAGQQTEEEIWFLGEGRVSEGGEALAPSDWQVQNEIVPALAKSLDQATDNDIQTACLIALAKVGRDTDAVRILDLFAKFLPDNSQEVQETATLALGLSAREEAIPLLVHLVTDDPEARRVTGGRGDVSDRTRSFAAYGLGLIAWSTSSNDAKRVVFDALAPILHDSSIADRNIRVAVIQALSLLRPNISDQKGLELFTELQSALRRAWDRPLGKSEQLIQSHLPLAVAKLFGPIELGAHPDIEEVRQSWREDFLAALRDRNSHKTSNEIIQSCAMAVGLMADPVRDVDHLRLGLQSKVDGERLDALTAQALQVHATDGIDQQARFFSMIAMAKQGGHWHRDFLIRRLDRASNRVEQGWAALSLGVLAFEERQRDDTVDHQLIGEALMRHIDEKNDSMLGAVSVALGLCEWRDAEDELLTLLDDRKSEDELAGYFCIGLALMGADSAVLPLRDLVEASIRRDLRLQQAAIALGRLRDKEAGKQLIALIEADDRPRVQKMAAIASALSYLGDRDSVSPLISMLENQSAAPLARAFAAVALGGVGDKEPLPWNSKISVDINYRAAVETLTNSVGTGILDIL